MRKILPERYVASSVAISSKLILLSHAAKLALQDPKRFESACSNLKPF